MKLDKTPNLICATATLGVVVTAIGCMSGVDTGSDTTYTNGSPMVQNSVGGTGGSGGAPTHDDGAGGAASRAGSGGSPGTGGSAGVAGGWPNTGGTGGEGPNTGGTGGGGPGTGGTAGGCSDNCRPSEICGNGCDDDCNGFIDDQCVVVCEDTDGTDCNSDMGYGDHCSPQENLNGCSDAKFWAWCNRRNSSYPDIWDSYLRAWVDARCDGTITLEDPDNDGYQSFICTDSNGRRWECTTPLVVAFDPTAAVQFEATRQRFALDPARDGQVAREWPSRATPWLAIDLDGSGAIESGSELFGSATRMSDGRLARDGFEALADLDDNSDGIVDARDVAWSRLLLWSDVNGDGLSQSGELVSASSAGVQAIELAHEVSSRCDAHGNCEGGRSLLVWSDGASTRRGAVIDVYLRTGAPRSGISR